MGVHDRLQNTHLHVAGPPRSFASVGGGSHLLIIMDNGDFILHHMARAWLHAIQRRDKPQVHEARSSQASYCTIILEAYLDLGANELLPLHRTDCLAQLQHAHFTAGIVG